MRTVDQIVGRDALRNGKSVKSTGENGTIRCLTLSSMRRGRIDLTHNKPVPLTDEDAHQFTVRQRDVFIVRGNGSKHLCGQAGLVENQTENLVFPDLFIRVPLPETLLAEFFVAVWNSGPVRAEIDDKAKTTSGIWKINQTHIASTRIPVPALAEQHRLVTYLDGLDRKADALERLQGETAVELDAMLPAILDRAFKGEL
jgi:type I restriction enzyme S subunit